MKEKKYFGKVTSSNVQDNTCAWFWMHTKIVFLSLALSLVMLKPRENQTHKNLVQG